MCVEWSVCGTMCDVCWPSGGTCAVSGSFRDVRAPEMSGGHSLRCQYGLYLCTYIFVYIYIYIYIYIYMCVYAPRPQELLDARLPAPHFHIVASYRQTVQYQVGNPRRLPVPHPLTRSSSSCGHQHHTDCTQTRQLRLGLPKAETASASSDT